MTSLNNNNRAFLNRLILSPSNAQKSANKFLFKTCQVKTMDGIKNISIRFHKNDLNRNKIIKTKNVNNLKNGFYTYMIEWKNSDFHFSFLPVHNSLEWCSKHFQLRNNINNSSNSSHSSHVIVAGELHKTDSGIKINTHSGSYTKRLISNNSNSLKFNKIAKHLLTLYANVNVNVTVTNNSLLPKEPINLKNIPIEVIQNGNARVGLPGFTKRKIEENAPKGQKTKLVKQARNNLRQLVKKAKKNT